MSAPAEPSPQQTAPIATASADRERVRNLRRMKAFAVGLLGFAAVVYVVATLAGAEGAWGYVQAAAEAAMVGALADWFAVTALFRHPLSLPIPHTAIIPRRKDQIGRSLGEFMEGNFLTREVIVDRLGSADVSRRLGEWLSQPENAERASEAISEALVGTLAVVDDDTVHTGLEAMLRQRVSAGRAAPLLGRLIEVAIDNDHHRRLLDVTLAAVHQFIDDNRATFHQQLHKESPWWVPESLDARVFDKLVTVTGRFITDVRSDPTHDLHSAVDDRVRSFRDRLRDDPELIAQVDQIVTELLDHPTCRAMIESSWLDAKRHLEAAATDATSGIRSQLTSHVHRSGVRLVDDQHLRATIDGFIERAICHVVERYRSEASAVITSTIDRWDGATTARKLELQIGRDLQFIRINGTIVGGLAGIVIHAIAELL